MTMQTDLQAAVDKATAASAKLHDVVHGDAVSTVTTESGPIKTVAKTIADNEAAIDASRTELDQKVADAAASAATSETARIVSETAESASTTARLGAEIAEAGALTSETNADAAKAAAEIARDAASASAGQAATSQSASAASKAGAAASETAAATSETNAATSDGIATTKSLESSASAGAAALSATASAASATEASGAAASLNLPTASGQAGQYLRQKQDETGLEYAEVDLASRVAKSGDTMTGDLTLPNLVATGNLRSGSVGDDGRNTGFKIADGTDIGELNRVSQYYDDRIDNCAGYIPGANCNADLQWTPPNGDWWNWGLGFSPANPNGYDFAGGQTIGYQPVSAGFVYASYNLAADEIGGGEYRRDYNNCNCGGFNCYSNCNCNCACACDCDCNCGDA